MMEEMMQNPTSSANMAIAVLGFLVFMLACALISISMRAGKVAYQNELLVDQVEGGKEREQTYLDLQAEQSKRIENLTLDIHALESQLETSSASVAAGEDEEAELYGSKAADDLAQLNGTLLASP